MGAEMLEELFGVARMDSIRSLRQKVARVAIEQGAASDVVQNVSICVHEALTNVARHAYEGRPGPIEVRVVRAQSELIVAVRDMGCGVAPGGAVGFGTRIMDGLSRRLSMAGDPGGGTEVRMSFPVGEPRRSAHQYRQAA